MDFRVFAPNTRITARNRDRSRFRAWGILGGGPGAPSDFILNPGGNRERVLGNTDTVTMEPGDVIHIHSPGGGGRGDPLDREPERVALDVQRGYVSVGAAKAAYGVVIREDAVDAAATDALRASRRRDDETPHFAYGPEREAHEAVWTADAYDQLTRLLAMLPVHWRFFVKTKMFEAMAENVQDVSRVFATVREAYPEIPEVS
jgi:N-methylhydantoinase B